MLKNIKVKIACIMIAVGIWSFVVLQEEYSYNFDIPVHIENIKTGRTLAKEIPDKIIAKLEGNGHSLLSLWLFRTKNLRMDLDLSTITSYFEFSSEKLINYIHIPRGFEDVRILEIIDPDSIVVELDRQVSKTVLISSKNILLSTAAGYYQVGDFLLEPDTVNISGPFRYLRNITEIQTEMAELKDKKKNISEKLRLIIPNKALITANIKETVAKADIQKLSEKEFKEIGISVKEKPDDVILQIVPQAVDIKILGGLDYLSQISREQITAYINYNPSWIRNREYKVPIIFDIPENCMEYKSDLTEVLVYIR